MEQKASAKTTSEKEMCKKTDSDEPAAVRRGPHAFANLAEWVASPEYAAVAAQARIESAERKRIKRNDSARRRAARKQTGLPLKAVDFCRIVFSVPTVPLLPAPGQVVRWPAETIYSPIMAKASTPRRTRLDHHRPQWQIDAERTIVITPREFGYLVQALDMTVEECAAYLRVTVASVRAWESGDESIPFAAFWLLRLTIQADRFNTRFPEWEGWVIAEDGPSAGKLIDANRSYAFSPQEIACIPSAWHQMSRSNLRAEKLQAELDRATAENTRLRQLFNAQGVTTELRQMQDKLAAMLDSIGTAEIIDYRPAVAGHQLEKAA